jgi:hypothetical protein
VRPRRRARGRSCHRQTCVKDARGRRHGEQSSASEGRARDGETRTQRALTCGSATERRSRWPAA